jgi:hypothetical protein
MSSSIAKQHLNMLLLRHTRVDEQVRKFHVEDDAKRYAESSKAGKKEMYDARQRSAALAIPFTPLVRAPAATAAAAGKRGAAAKAAAAAKSSSARDKRRAAAADAIASNPFIDAVESRDGDEDALRRQIKRARRVAAGSVAGQASAPAQLLLAARAQRSTLMNNVSLLTRDTKATEGAAKTLRAVLDKAVLPGLARKRGGKRPAAEVERKRGDDSDDD